MLPWPLQLQVGVEFEASTRMQDTSVSFGYQLDLPKANLLFKGTGLSLRVWGTGERWLRSEPVWRPEEARGRACWAPSFALTSLPPQPALFFCHEWRAN